MGVTTTHHPITTMTSTTTGNDSCPECLAVNRTHGYPCVEVAPHGCAEDMSEGEYQAMFDDVFYDVLESSFSLNAPAYPWIFPPMAPTGIWKTRDGRVLEIAKMSTLHIGNAIRYFDRAGWSEHEKIGELRAELARRSK